MRIERIELDGFGRFAGALWNLPAGLTVVVGANEAGKTTLLNAVRALLFGFESTREGRAWYPALAGGRRGGRLSLVTAAGERWLVERHGERGGTGSLTVRAPNGNTGGQETLDRLLAGADRELFTKVFAFGLGELQSMDSLSGEGVRSRIYGAGSGLGGMSAADLERQLRQRQEAIFRPQGRNQELNRLVARIEELRAQIAELETQPARYEELHRALAAVGGDRQRIDAERHEAAETAARAGRLVEAQVPAAELAALEADLAAGDAALDTLPAGIEAELVTLETARDAAAEALAAHDSAVSALVTRLAETTVDEALLAEAAEIEALVGERPLEAARARELPELRAAIDLADAELAEVARRAGGAPAWLLDLDDSVPAIQATRDAEARLTAREVERQRLNARVESLREALPAADPADEGLDAATVADRRAALRQLTELRMRRELAAAPGGVPRWAIILAAALAAAALVGTAVGLLAGLLPGALAGIVAGVAAAGTAASFIRPSSTPRRGGEQREGDLLAAAGLPPDADATAIRRADDALALAAATIAAGDRSREAEGTRASRLAAAERELTTAMAAADVERRAWEAWVAGHRLPAGCSPEAARAVLDLVPVARRAAAVAASARARCDAATVASHAFAERVDALLARLGRPAAREGLRDATVIALGESLAGARSAAERRRSLAAERADAERRRGPLADRAAAAAAGLDALLAAHDAPAVATLRARARAATERRELHARARELRARLAGIAGGEGRLPDLLASAAISDPATLQVERDEAARRVAELDAAAHELSTRAGELRSELARLEQGAELGARRQELASVAGRAAALAREWAVRAVALRLLEETRQRYERERQPRVVQDASAHFARITGDAYERIVAAPGEAAVRVEAATGAPRLTDELSRGTAEQLYLALRFGLIEQFARSTEPLPVVMDDILVNFDANRAARAAGAIRALAERHQVLYFTCHPWTAELLDPERASTITLD